MNKKVSLSTAVLIVVSVLMLGTFVSFKYYQRGEDMKKEIPYLLTGDQIEYFDLDCMDETTVDGSVLNSNKKPKMFFIFSRPCSPCNKNIVYWNKFAELLKEQVDCYGIVLDSLSEAYNFNEKRELKFKIYVPQDLDKFLKEMKLKLNFPQTVLYTNRVEMLKMGDLKPEDAVKIINTAKRLGA